MSISISVRNLSYTYTENAMSRQAALNDVSFDIKKGEIVGIVGHTGSGKSTLVKHLNGLIRCDKGHIFVNGTDIWENPKKISEFRYKVGLVFQYPEYQLFEETAYKDIAYGPKNMGLSDSETDSRVRLAADFVGIKPDQLACSPFDFSGGQKRRIAIAGVIAMQPEVLVLDEPSAGLDPGGRKRVFELISSYRARTGATVIVVSHNMEDIAAYADRVLVLNNGRVAAFDTPENVFSDAAAISACSLDLPAAARIAEGLRKNGIEIPKGTLTVEQLKNALLPLLKGGAV